MGLPALSIAATIGSTVLGIGGQIAQGNENAALANYQAQVAANNQILANRAAQDAKARGDIAAANAQTSANSLLGRQKTALAANGVNVNQGTALDIQGNTKAVSENEALTIRSNAAREAYRYETEGANYGNEEAVALSKAANDQSAIFGNALGTALTGGGSVADKWYKFYG